MIFLLNAIKIIFLLGFLVLIHESGHFCVAKLCKVRVNEFAIGFGPVIFSKQGKVTKYALRLIPLGGFVSMEGEDERSTKEGSFSETSIIKRIAIVMAGGLVNIIFALFLFWCLCLVYFGFKDSFMCVGQYLKLALEDLIQLFTGKAKMDQVMGPVGISNVVAQTSSITDFIYIMSVVSLSLGITNLLPFPPLDGGKVVFLIIEAIIKKPLSQKFQIVVQMIGLCALLGLSVLVTFKDIINLGR